MNVRLKYDLTFTAGVYHNSRLAMNTYNLRLWMTTNTVDSAEHAIAYERINYFVYSQLDSTIFINADLAEQCNQLLTAGLDITTMPGDPVDQLVGIMLYSKLNAILEDRMIIMETELSSSIGQGMTYLHSDYETTSGFAQPDWWITPDVVHSAFVPADSEKIVSIPQFTTWRDLELDWPDTETPTDTGNVVVFADFKQPNATE
jgi:hypothetical protein